RRQLWVGPRATLTLRADLASILGNYTRTALSRADDGNPVRKALRMVRYYYEMAQRLVTHWEQAASSRWGSPKQVPMSEILSTVIAPEFLEVRDRLKPRHEGLLREMLLTAQKILGDAEGVLALFKFRDSSWAPRSDLNELDRGAFMLSRYGLTDEAKLRNASRSNQLLGTYGVLTNRRLVFVRPGGKSTMIEVDLGKIEDVAVQDGLAPRLQIKYLDTFDQHHTFRYCSSGNYLFPRPGTPLDQVQRLAARILGAQERYWERQQPPLAEVSKLPPPPPGLGEVLASIPRRRLDRLNEAVLYLLRDTGTPRDIRKFATTGKDILLTALRGLRERAAAGHVALGGLGERVIYLPGELFDHLDDGILIAEDGIIVSGLGVARLGWGEIQRLEILQDRSWTAALIGGSHSEVGIRSKNTELVTWLGTLISALVHAAAI
ncbi:MAG: hypothetical protein KAI47_01645, partial [Deltaproteobacteria bacterium]|nr:hypothetical protein [Deltaproteobacteria bacterium]